MSWPRFKSLRSRLLIVLLGLTALPALLIGGLAYRSARQAIEARVVAQLTSIADLKKEQIISWIDDRAADARLLADNFLNEEHFTVILDPRSDPVRSAAFAGFLTDNLRSLQQARAGYSEIFFVDAAGRVILSTDAAAVGRSLAGDPAIVNTLASPTGAYIQDIHRHAGSAEIEMAFGHVLHAVDLTTNTVLPEVNGAVIIRVRMDQTIYPLIRAWPGMGASGETLLVRADGEASLFLSPLRFQADAPLNFRVPLTSADAQPAHLSTAGQEGVIETPDYRGVAVLAAYRTIPQTGWGFVAKEDLAEAFAPVTELTRIWILVTVLILLAAAGVAVLLAQALTRPLARLVTEAQAVAAGKFEQGVPLHRTRADEIGQLAVAFEQMVAAVRDRESALKAHAEELELLNRLGRDIAATLDLREIADRVVTLVAGRFDGFLSGLLLCDDAQAELVTYAAAGRGARHVAPGRRVALGHGLIGRSGQTRQTQLANQAPADPGFVPLAGLTIRAETAVPIVREDKLLGVLVVSSDRADAFQPDDVLLLETLAAQLATSIENGRLLEMAQQRASEIGALAAIGRRLTATLDLNTVLDGLLEETARILPGQAALAVMLYDAARSDLWIEAARGYPNQTWRNVRVRLGEGVTGRVAATRQPVLLGRTGDDPAGIGIEGMAPSQSEMAVPLVFQDHLVGVINVESPQPAAFNGHHLRLFTAIADSAATAIAHARLFRETRRLAGQLQVAAQISRHLGAILDLDSLLRGVSDHITTAFGYDYASVVLMEGDDLIFRPNLNRPGQANGQPAAAQRLSIEAAGLCGWAARHRQTVFVGDVATDSRYRGIPEFPHTHSELVVPLIAHGEVAGLLDLRSGQRNAFDEADRVLIEALAGPLAVAIRNARLFRDLNASYDHTLDALVAALDARDKETEGHSRRVVAYTLALARRMNVPDEELTTIRRGALLHDIGKIGVPDAILLKPGPLNDEERAIMRRHPAWGESILSGIPFLRGATEIVRAHQERWDGQGYPLGLTGEDIPFGARIFAVADTFDAITSDRPYRAGRPYAVARSEIEAGRGTQFDPRVVDAFLQIPESEWRRLQSDVQKQPRATGPLPALVELPAAPEPAADVDALNRLITAVSGSLDLNEILQEAARTAVEALGVAASGLFLYEPQSDTLALAAEHGLPPALKERFARFPVAGFHNEPVVREACTRIYDDASQVPAFVELGLSGAAYELGMYLCVPLTAKGEVTGVMGVFSRRPHTFDSNEVALYRAIGEQIGLAIANARQHQALQELSTLDPLTGAYNRRYFDTALDRELQRCARYQHCVSLILLDLDNFKSYNDSYGHPAGDEALRQVVALLQTHLRAADVVARYGGEEFAVIMPETEPPGALAAAEKIRAAIAAHHLAQGRLTASLGVAHCAAAEPAGPDSLIAMADQALYLAKRRGRNAVSVWEPELTGFPRQTG